MSAIGNQGNRGGRGGHGRGRGRGSPATSIAGSDAGLGGRGGGSGNPRGQTLSGRGGGFIGRPSRASFTRGFDTRGRGTGGEGKQLNVRDEMPMRPGWGTLGTEMKVRVNSFAVKILKNIVYDYHVAITPYKVGAGRRARIFQILESNPIYAPHVRYIAHDSSQRLVSATKLPQPLSIPVPYVEEGQTAPLPNALVFTVEIRLIRELDMRELNAYMDGQPDHSDDDTGPMISALNLILQQHAASHGTRVGKNRYFFPSSGLYPLGPGLEAYRGFFMSVRPTYKQLTVNVNVCMTAFYTPGNLADAMIAFNGSTGGMPGSFTRGLKVSTRYLGYTRKRTVMGIMSTTARQMRFQCDELNGVVTMEEYFQRRYGIHLDHAHDLPVINVSGMTCLPAELCEILPNQPYRGRLGNRENAEMTKYACNPPDTNAEIIVSQGFPALGLRWYAQGVPLQGFRITLNPEMVTVPSRVLPAPRITYRSGNCAVHDGSWNILNVKFHVGSDLRNWAVLLVQDGGDEEFTGTNDPALQQFIEMFAAKCRSSGMNVPTLPTSIATSRLPHPRDDPSRTQALEQIRKAITQNLDRNNKPSFVLVLLSKIDSYIYPGIKKLCDTVLGIHTVHMQLKKARGNNQDQYFSNVALKVNAKLGGTNHLLDPQSMRWLTEKRTMLVGISLTDPGPTSKLCALSIVAVVASVDSDFVQFPASLQPQKSNLNKGAKEMVEKLDDLMVERLLLYQKKNKSLPERIFVYRNGVSEGEYNLVLQHELPKLLVAFKKVSPEALYRPKLTITVCGKTRRARIIPMDYNVMDHKGNTQPGTVIDKGITNVYSNDFYLQAHPGLQGHARPKHYVVIYDEQHWSADQIQQGTHTTSYGYVCATKAVSLVPPAYYATLACKRGRSYINSILDAGEDKTSTMGGRETLEEQTQQVDDRAMKFWGNGVHVDLKESMFYI
ncbi:Piwi-domain-containing protein [Sparassis crispa]|uniref:Piwi-domain-containing protein n=1 Tax=Sparassis crispa TaxID=139825 RepID=A0A401GT27_9APHY|nr:Piwi-domain-containing protein [Sparassis crispa]GBE85375.1 Piwi-domain-containing protein [Sparassis crispa]